MTLIRKGKPRTPSAHVIIIGVGDYPHWPNAQLSSPPISSRELTDWFLTEYNNPQRPLASLALLVSDPKSTKYTEPGGQVHNIRRATLKHVSSSIRGWINRCNMNSGNIAIFFFCGHGIMKNRLSALLLEDFHKDPLDTYRNAIDFYRFHLAMEKCTAFHQCFFIDACRTPTDQSISVMGPIGDPIIQSSVIPGNRLYTTHYSTLAGKKAYGQPNKASVFTEALIKVLNGAGCDNFQGKWCVYSDRITIGLNHLLPRTRSDANQIVSGETAGSFPIHYPIDKPIIPVTIGCDPSMANEFAHLSFSSRNFSETRQNQEPSDWNVDLKEGEYNFHAIFNPPMPPYQDSDIMNRHIRPPYRMIKHKVE